MGHPTHIHPLPEQGQCKLQQGQVARLVADVVEHRTDVVGAHRDETTASGPAVATAAQASAAAGADAELDHAIERRLTRIAFEVLAGALVLGAVMGGTLFGWKMLPIAALVLVGYIIRVLEERLMDETPPPC